MFKFSWVFFLSFMPGNGQHPAQPNQCSNLIFGRDRNCLIKLQIDSYLRIVWITEPVKRKNRGRGRVLPPAEGALWTVQPFGGL
ncbi:hypothetical protein B0H10DRAFT_2034107 [Mycena sp. CBHHK59/15]|nr:hypothetical protein B0H10DRAFT_2034107 [Mycena sp. CBHHK59/15]